MRTYFLITNINGMKYWSYLGTLHNTYGNHLEMVKKYGNIYINQENGWFTKSCIKEVHAVVTQENFPQKV